jgi:glucans biosynthesis protein C
MSERRHELDWLRVLAVLLLIYFHSARVFDEWDFYVKNPTLSRAFSTFVSWMDLWFMPLFFLIAGAASWFALSRRSGREYAKERSLRLLVPFAFGMVVLIPPQVWAVCLQSPDLPHGYWSFLDFYFTSPPLTEVIAGKVGDAQVMGYTLETGQLWFILYLFIFSMVCLPLFLWLKGEKGRRFVDRLVRSFRHRGAFFLLSLPIVAYDIWPDMDQAIYRLFHVFPFVYGFVLYSDKRLAAYFDRYRGTALTMAAAFSCAYAAIYLSGSIPAHYEGIGYLFIATMRAFATWFWLIAIMGYGRKYLNFANGVLGYASRGSYPFYILHQTVIVLLAYEVVQWNAGAAWKYLFLTTASLGVTLLAYDVLVRRTRPTRFLFGMK